MSVSMEDNMSDVDGEQQNGHAVQDEEGVENEHIEQRVINEEYKIWKKNSPFLYDMLYARALEWPTLSVQWFPDKQLISGTECSMHRVLFGTHTSNQAQNYLQIASLEIPELYVSDVLEFDEQKGEIGGHGYSKRPFTFQVTQRINHPGEVNKARYMPQNPNIIASMCTDGRTLVFDRTKHSMNPRSDGQIVYEVELNGHEKEGYGLSWNSFEDGQLVTGSEDGTARVWDIRGFSGSSKPLSCTRVYRNHSAIVNDVQYHPIQKSLIGTVSDDLSMKIMDMRNPSDEPANDKQDAHYDAVNCIAFHPEWECIVATGSADKSVAIWDLRNLKQRLHSFEAHKDSVVNLEWLPQDPTILASAGYDRRIMIWNASNIGNEQTADEAEDGPPELSFIHGGFTNRICDFNWNPNIPWLMLASAEDNLIQVFQPASPIVFAESKPHSGTDIEA